MTQLTWNAAGERKFEAGVDRGVLFIKGADGVPWNGLISVSDSPSGGEVTPYYIDGIKYLDHVAHEEFRATIEAYTYPEEFGLCDGTLEVDNGLFVTQQRKKSFGLSYRTLVGNDLEGTDHGYKIHLVYNATASPTQQVNNTLSNVVDPYNFSWEITSKPPTFVGYAPTAHFEIDSRKTPSELLGDIEDILYGTETSAPRLPSVPELLHIFQSHETSTFDAGYLGETYFTTFDAGELGDTYTSSIDGGSP